ncbi:MAG: GTP-binding protein [Actinobacteria bacterium]|nr:GTP-binding protein [Actinomycetota bacterium]
MSYQEPMFLPWDGRRVPLTFVGGYLGAGKTSVINEVLRHADRPIAVIVNDVGSINIDAALVRRRHGDTIELTDGCVCCSSIDGLGAAFDQIRARPTPPDHVIVELSGVAEPERMLPWGRSAGFVLDGLVVVVAADQLEPGRLPEWVHVHLDSQIRAADLLVLTKTDLVDAAGVAAAHDRLTELAPGTPVIVREHGPDAVGALGRFLALGGRRPGGVTDVSPSTLFDAHEVSLESMPTGLTGAALDAWLWELRVRREAGGGRLVRAKGLALTSDLGLVLVQVVGVRQEIDVVPEPELAEPTDLVVITLRSA